MVGLLTGPLGLLAGAATGAVVGAIVDTAEVEDAHGVIDAMKRSIDPGTAALLAIVREPTPTLLDRAAAAHDGLVLRRDRGEVELGNGVLEPQGLPMAMASSPTRKAVGEPGLRQVAPRGPEDG